jgi:hypothetical protein
MSGLITIASLPEVKVDVAALDRAAAELKNQAGLVGPATQQADTAWSGLRSSYETPESGELIGKMTVVRTAGDDFDETMGTVADVLGTCADELAGAERRLEQLKSEVTSLRSTVQSFRADQAELLDVDAAQAGDVWGPGQFEQHAALVAEREAIRTLIDTAVDEATTALKAVSDPVGVAGLTGPADATALSTSWSGEQTRFEGDLALAVLARLATTDASGAEALVASHPEWVDQLRDHPPASKDVLSWWNELGEADGGGESGSGPWSDAQRALVLGAPAVIGALGGVPPLARVAANRQTASERLEDSEDELARLKDLERQGERFDEDPSSVPPPPGSARVRAARIAELETEIDYLTRATVPDESGHYAVQLMLYDPDRSRIVEMIGTPGPDTRTTVTYSPGTGTDLQAFYGDGVQQVSRYLTAQDPSTVAFVWKDGEFPGGGDDDNMVGGILEANETDRAEAAGEQLAAFQEQLLADPTLAPTYRVGVGHSWGLAAVTGSEGAGAHYDQVESLAGAYMPPDWSADPETQYSHQTYRDFLSIFQDLGVVGEGNNPDVSDDFASSTYPRDGDLQLYLPDGSSSPSTVVPSGPPPSLDVTSHPVENHNDIASSRRENLFVLDAIQQRLEKGRPAP